MRWLIGLALLVSACGGGSDATNPNQDAQIGGTWSFSHNISDRVVGISCTGSGQIVINQSGTQFTGNANQRGLCTASDGSSVDASGQSSIQGGQVNGMGVSFRGGNCAYTGTASGSPINRLDGQETCQLDAGGQTLNLAGTWSAGR